MVEHVQVVDLEYQGDEHRFYEYLITKRDDKIWTAFPGTGLCDEGNTWEITTSSVHIVGSKMSEDWAE